ncbi:PEPxxWA-CTERM sorting domain-containing protein [uncultured Parasphingorhabdus sp.]|uniref:PEPxxWA-CTERM sorting domain-containing protein n=1 Tax=uncultured Parasphingorhabdus sp. TaxID=2709694 RepID=UPI0030D9E1B0|tara:strand:- start:17286 stop:17882 length:597 start_codon:yes stop_codon:yes gene_type:complete
MLKSISGTLNLVPLSLAGLLMASPAHAVVFDSSIFIPDSEVIINFNGTGLDWVYAGPIAPNEFGVGNIQPASYRAAEGWRVSTVSEWASRPDWQDFTRAGFATPTAVASFNDHSVYRFASEYWSDFTHVDLNDYAAGRLTDGVNGALTGVPETIYVRFSSISAAVPEPSTWAFMIFGFGAIGGAMRRQRKANVKVSYA